MKRINSDMNNQYLVSFYYAYYYIRNRIHYKRFHAVCCEVSLHKQSNTLWKISCCVLWSIKIHYEVQQWHYVCVCITWDGKIMDCTVTAESMDLIPQLPIRYHELELEWWEKIIHEWLEGDFTIHFIFIHASMHSPACDEIKIIFFIKHNRGFNFPDTWMDQHYSAIQNYKITTTWNGFDCTLI